LLALLSSAKNSCFCVFNFVVLLLDFIAGSEVEFGKRLHDVRELGDL
jgi:hypothetical protein